MRLVVLPILIALLSNVWLRAQDKVVSIPGTEASIKLVLIEAAEVEQIDGRTSAMGDYFIGQYEVTHDQFRIFQEVDFDSDDAVGEQYVADAITRPSPPYEDFSKGMGKEGGYPVVSITQQGAVRYCQWLYQKTGVFFRLPTELEWQYACEQGSISEQVEIEEEAWYFDNSYEKFHKVGEKKPNGLDLYDMLGNVAEWTSDQYTKDYPAGMNDESWIKPTSRHSRTVKGGSYLSDIEECNCKFRERSNPRWQMRDPQIPKSLWWNTDAPFVGFRVVAPAREYSNEEIEAYYRQAIVD